VAELEDLGECRLMLDERREERLRVEVREYGSAPEAVADGAEEGRGAVVRIDVDPVPVEFEDLLIQ